jgi:dihydroxyacetone kinase-like protein
MPDAIGYEQVCALLQGAVGQIRQHHEMLSQLDSAVGDGDHGTTILRAMEAVAQAMKEHSSQDIQSLLSQVAWAVMGCDGGSTGPLLGSFFMGMSEGVGQTVELDAAALVEALAAGVTQMQQQTRAQVGDKTMMDAFLPAIAALRVSLTAPSIKSLLTEAAKAAEQGAEATKNMRAKFGRARNLGDRVIGHPDPGAVSVSLIFRGFSEALP